MGFRKARKDAGMTLEQVASKLGVAINSVSQWERGIAMPAAKRLLEIAELYGVTVDELLREEAGE